MKSKHGPLSNCSKYLKKNKQNVCYSTFDYANLSMDAIWVLLITESLHWWFGG